MRADLRLAVRMLRNRPLFSMLVILTLALGIGANTAIFSVVNGVLLRPLPYRAPADLALIWSKWTNFDKTWVSAWELVQYRGQKRLFQDVAAWGSGSGVTITGDQSPENVPAAEVTANLLPLLGVAPVAGRVIAPEEDVPNGPRVVLVAHDLWIRRFGGDPGLVGRTLMLDGASWTVIGVLPKTFRLPLEFQTRAPAELLMPLRLDTANPDPGSHSYYAVARFAAGVGADQATRELRALATRWTGERRFPESMRFTAFAVALPDEVNGGVRRPLLVLVASVGLLLLLASANVAHLLLVRADDRAREIAVRSALGAGRGQLLQLALTESLLLAGLGGAVGLGLAWLGAGALAVWAPASVPRATEVGIDGPVLLFAVVTSLITGLLFGAAPAGRSSRVDLVSSLKDGGRGGSEGPGRRRSRDWLVGIQMAGAVVLVIGAGLTGRSFRNLTRIDPGFEIRNALTLRVALPDATYPGTAERIRFFQELGDEVRGLAGVKAAGFVRVLPIAAEIGDGGMRIEGRPVAPGEPNRSGDWQVVTPGYFEAMGIRLVKGRFFDRTDAPDGAQVIAVNETLAKQYFPGESAVGKRVQVGGAPGSPWRTVIGVVGDVHHNGLTNPAKRAWFVPHNQFDKSWGITRSAMTLVVRTAGDPRSIRKPIEALIVTRDPNLPITEVATLGDVMGGAVREQRFTATLMAGLALVTLVLAAIGIYGVMSYSVTRRNQEIGVRLALGAAPGRVRRLVIVEGMVPAVVGIGAGLAAAMGLSRFLGEILYGVGPLDPLTFLVVPLLLTGVAFGSALGPAHRATRVDPVVALRRE